MNKPLRVVLDAGHRAKHSKPNDRGAAAGGYTEVDIVLPCLLAVDARLRGYGHDVLLLLSGEYPDRWQEAHAWGADAYVQGHMNSDGGDYGAVFFDHRSKRGASLASWVAHELEGVVPWAVHSTEARPDSNGRPGDEGEAPYACIHGCYPLRPVGLLLEPGFIDRPAHRLYLLANPGPVGEAIARGVHTWRQGR